MKPMLVIEVNNCKPLFLTPFRQVRLQQEAESQRKLNLGGFGLRDTKHSQGPAWSTG